MVPSKATGAKAQLSQLNNSLHKIKKKKNRIHSAQNSTSINKWNFTKRNKSRRKLIQLTIYEKALSWVLCLCEKLRSFQIQNLFQTSESERERQSSRLLFKCYIEAEFKHNFYRQKGLNVKRSCKCGPRCAIGPILSYSRANLQIDLAPSSLKTSPAMSVRNCTLRHNLSRSS